MGDGCEWHCAMTPAVWGDVVGRGGDSAQWGGTATSHRTLPPCRADLYHIYLSNLLSLRIEHFTFFPKEESSDKSGPLWNKSSLRPTCEGSNNKICDIFKLYIQTLKEERQPLHKKIPYVQRHVQRTTTLAHLFNYFSFYNFRRYYVEK